MTDENEQLRNVVKWRRKRRRDETLKLGTVVAKLLEGQVWPKQAVFESVARVWRQLLPAELAEHSQIAEICGGQLKVQVDLSSYMYELQLCSSELLTELQKKCPQARLREIKIVSD